MGLPIVIILWITVQSTRVVSLDTANFTKLVLEQPANYVDKSLLIKAFLEANSSIISILRPREWGKTLNLDMVRKFLRIEVNSEGIVIPKRNQTGRKCFTGRRKVPPLKISQVTEAMAHQGIYPVIWLDLECIKYSMYSQMKPNFAILIKEMFEEYGFLKNYTKVEDELDRLRRYNSANITTEEITNSIRFLSELLYKYFNRKVFVFVNDYNMPFNLHVEMPLAQLEPYNEIVNLLDTLFSTSFNDNPYLKKVFLTATLPSSKAHSEVTSHLNNFQEYTLLDPEFSQFYGFAQNEVEDLLNRTSTEIEPLQMENLYKGFNQGVETVYNPSSVCRHIELKTHQASWMRKDTLPHQRVHFRLFQDDQRQPLRDLVSGDGILSTILPAIDYQNFNDSSTLYSALVFSGYLNPTVVDKSSRKYQLTVPNEEIMNFFVQKIGSRVKETLDVDVTAATNTFMQMLPGGLTDGFKKGYQSFISGLKFSKIEGKEVEEIHYDLMLVLMHTLSPQYSISHRNYSNESNNNEIVHAITLIPKVEQVDNVIFIGYEVFDHMDHLTPDLLNGTMRLVNSFAFDPKMVKCTKIREILRIGIALAQNRSVVEFNKESLI